MSRWLLADESVARTTLTHRALVALSAVALVGVVAATCRADSAYAPASGDIVFQTSRSSQSTAVQVATKSPYSHMGIVYIIDGKPVVFEAVEPVKKTPLAKWAARGVGGEFVAKRLASASSVLTPEAIEKMLATTAGFLGKHYDLYFEWSDKAIYCSELVWKTYDRALGIQLGKPGKLRDFDLSAPAVRKKLRERWGGAPPLDETVISPGAMFESDQLVEVYRGKSS